MEQRQWQDVFSIVRKHQRTLLSTFNNDDKKEYHRLNEILNELEPYAYGEIPCKN